LAKKDAVAIGAKMKGSLSLDENSPTKISMLYL